jgi:inhibitor of cysteine peptidase
MPDANQTVSLTGADRGKSARVRPNDVVTIRLNENPTTGYRWTVDKVDHDVLRLEGSDFNPTPGGGIGGGGEHTFRFRARTEAATGSVQLKLWREWEGDRSIIERFDVIIDVADRV